MAGAGQVAPVTQLRVHSAEDSSARAGIQAGGSP